MAFPSERESIDLLALLQTREQWIRRKTETLTWDDEANLTRTIEFEVTLPEHAHSHVGYGTYHVLPLTEVRRAPARQVNVRLRGATNEQLPMLTRQEERDTVVKGYTGLASRTQGFESYGVSVKDLQAYIYEQVASVPLGDANDKGPFNREVDPNLESILLECFGFRNSRIIYSLVPKLSMRDDDIVSIFVSHSEPIRMRRPSRIRKPLYGMWKTGDDQRLTVADSSGDMVRIDSDPIGRRKFIRKNLMGKLHFHDSVSFKLPVLGCLDGQSYHEEVICPQGVYIARAQLWALYCHTDLSWLESIDEMIAESTSPNDESPDIEQVSTSGVLSAEPAAEATAAEPDAAEPDAAEPDAAEPDAAEPDAAEPAGLDQSERQFDPSRRMSPVTTELIIVMDDESHCDRTHLYFSSTLASDLMSKDDFIGAEVQVTLRPTYLNGLRAGTHMSGLSVVTIWALFCTLGLPSINALDPSRDLGIYVGFDSISIVAILVLGLTLPIGLLIRQDEHPLTKIIQGRFRARCFAISALMLLTALAIAVGVRQRPLYLLLLVVSIATTLLYVTTLVSALHSRAQIRRRSAFT
jgi:hypothetical protein